MTTIQTIALTAIRIDGGTQSRTALHDATVADYAEALTDGATLPPIVLFFDGTSHWLADGFHRFLANKRIGAVSMDAEVRAGSLTDAQLFSYGANQAHGLRRTNEDKRKAVQGTLALRPDWSDRAIAKHVGVNDKTVAAARAAICGNSADAPASRTVERNGTTYTMDTSGQKEAAKAKKAGPEGTTKATATAASSTPEQRAPGPASKTKPKTAAEQEREQAQEDAYGDTDPLDMLESMQKQIEDLTALVSAAEADDQKAETLKWRRISEAAQRGQTDYMDRLQKEKKEHERTYRWLARCGKAVGESDPEKIAACVEAFARQHKQVAA